MPGSLIVISGPSGVGKSTVVRRLVERLGATVSVSATTRRQSQQEKHGVDYYFISEDEFRRMIEQDELLEWAEYLGNFYGTPRAAVESALAEGRDMLLEIEVEGAKQVAKKFSAAIMVYLLPPSDEDLRRRLVGRSREGQAQIETRFANAKREIAQARESGVYDHWVVNVEVDRAVDEIAAIVEQRSR